MLGAARRVGKAIPLELARGGASVFVRYGASGAAAAATVDEIEALGVSAWAVQADLRKTEDIDRLFDCGASRMVVRLEKPGALRFAESVGIVVERTPADFG